jgi:hypothetical protein
MALVELVDRPDVDETPEAGGAGKRSKKRDTEVQEAAA